MKPISMTVSILLTVTFSVNNTACEQKSNLKFYKNDSPLETVNNRESSPTNHRNKRQLEGNNAIPIDFFKELANISDVSELFDNYVDPNSIHPQLELHHKNPRGIVERAANNFPKGVGCVPEDTVVELVPLNPSTDPNIFYYPKCARVKRCNGCCMTPLLSCQPISEYTTPYKINKFQYNSNKRLGFLGAEHVVVVEHEKCACSCRVKEEHCAANQRYEKTLCECQCNNDDEQKKCSEQEDKIWDPKKCTCECRDSQPCTTGTVFDKRECKCVEISDPSVFYSRTGSSNLLDRRRFIAVTSNNTAWNVQ